MRLKSTVAVGRIARGNQTLLTSPPLSAMAPVDMADRAGEERPRQQPEHQVEDEPLVADPQDARERDGVDHAHQQGVGERPQEADDRPPIFELQILEDQVAEEMPVAAQAGERPPQRRRLAPSG